MNTRILIMHDESNDLGLLASELMADGCEVASVCSSREGLMLAHSERPDLILLDIGMLGEKGLPVYEQMRAAGLTRNIPVIFVKPHPQECMSDDTFLSAAGWTS